MSEGQKPSICRFLIFKITAEQAEQINRRRATNTSISERIRINNPDSTHWPIGAQAHIGNVASEGDEYPLLVVRVWPNEFADGRPGVNGQVFLDGNDTLWVTSVGEGTENGTWHWPPRV